MTRARPRAGAPAALRRPLGPLRRRAVSRATLERFSRIFGLRQRSPACKTAAFVIRLRSTFVPDFKRFRTRARTGGDLSLARGDEKSGEGDLSRTARAYQGAAPVLDAVWQLIGATLLGTVAGWWLDAKLETTPWVLVGGAVLGVGTGMYAFIRAALALNRKGSTPPRRGGQG